MSNVTPKSFVVAQATGFLPDVTTYVTQRHDHVGYRLASLAALPASCRLSRVRLAEAGFHYDPGADSSAVVFHKCGAAFSIVSLQPSASSAAEERGGLLSTPFSSSPLDFHRAASPKCPFLTSVLEGYTEGYREGYREGYPEGNTEPPLQGYTEGYTEPPLQGYTEPHLEGYTEGYTEPPPLPSVTQTAAVVSAVQQPSGEGSSTSAAVAYSSSSSCAVQSARFEARQDSVGRMSDLSEDCDARLPSEGARPTSRDTAHHSATTHSREGGEERPRMSLGSAVYPQFSTVQSRLATFHHWPLTAVFPPQTLVAQGFYYAGYADCLRCFYCGVGLKSWDERDDVTTEHVRWRPQCGFLLATKGRQFIQNTLNRLGQGCAE